ncbi:MAG: hypothetical protein FWG67_00245 [Defluviitaleaceae bacterium]|nr:hypothetical protein [Defluviitaleaceae bacterium]
MPKKEYRHTEYAKAAKKRARAKIVRVGFELNIPQTEMAKKFDVEAHGATSIHTLAKKLLLAYLEEHRTDQEEEVKAEEQVDNGEEEKGNTD